MGEFGNVPDTGGPAVQQTGGGTAGAATAQGGGTAAPPGTGTGTVPAPTTGQASGGQAADQTGPIDLGIPSEAEWKAMMDRYAEEWRTNATDDELRQRVAETEDYAKSMQDALDQEIAGEADSGYIEYWREQVDLARDNAQQGRQELHEREMARPAPDSADTGRAEEPQRPSAEAQYPGGARTGVDESGQGYEVDSSGQRTERERFDRFRPGGEG